MPKTIIATTEMYDTLADEIIATKTERVFNAREEIIIAHHEIGKLLFDFSKHNKVKIAPLVKKMVEAGAGTETSLYVSHQFYEKFPKMEKIDDLGLGKNISWNKIRLALMPVKEEQERVKEVVIEMTPTEVVLLRDCLYDVTKDNLESLDFKLPTTILHIKII